MRPLGSVVLLLLACAMAIGLVVSHDFGVLEDGDELSFFNTTEGPIELNSPLQHVNLDKESEAHENSDLEAQIEEEKAKEVNLEQNEPLDVSNDAVEPAMSESETQRLFEINEQMGLERHEEDEALLDTFWTPDVIELLAGSDDVVDSSVVDDPIERPSVAPIEEVLSADPAVESQELDKTVEIPNNEPSSDPPSSDVLVEEDEVDEPIVDPVKEEIIVVVDVAPYPIQLIYPSEDHEFLVVNETSLAWLSSFKKPVAIVAVCGPLHSGKSFLVNQLLGRTSGFALGPTTEPKTRGLWMWNTPIEVDDHVVVFLDTEGLFASNISEAYDAKIFAISSLMSSYLIYNSVKFIDQSAIDYIELLARRAQLFGIKAEIATSNEDAFVSVPKLLWVVQDFVQEMANGQTPQEWLLNLLAARKKSESTASSLPQLFEDIDCFTLFLPEYRREQLRHLDTIDESELLPEYRADMAILRDKVIQNANVKTRGKIANLTGLGAAALLRTLVNAANQGSFPEVPSIWKSFLKVQTQQAILDAVGFYDLTIEGHCERQGPFNAKELADVHSQVLNDTRSLFSRLTFGFKDLEQDNIEELLSKVSRLYSGIESSNVANLSRLCQGTFKSVREAFKLEIWRLELPIKKTDLQKRLLVLQERHLSDFERTLSRYREEDAFSTSLDDLKSMMKGETNGVELENGDLLQEVIVNATTEAVTRCSHHLSLQDAEELGVGSSILKQIQDQAMKLALDFFQDRAGFALDDLPTAPAARKALDTELRAVLKRFEVQNAERIERRTNKIAAQLSKEMTRAFEEIRLPQTRGIIESKVDIIKNEFVRKFDAMVKDVLGMDPTNFARQKLIGVAASDLQELYRRNNVKYDRIISDALPSLKSNIAPLLAEYWWPPAAEEFARRAVNATLQGIELIENEDLVAELANRFIDANLADEILGIWKKLALVAGCTFFLIVAAIVGLCCRRK